ncbi:MAG: HAMP domain-containing histidine kinase [Desulfobacter sp.]|nr:MAG: HAMP domain-containing histidine kinase [Desulfobacter sp.]
MTVEQRTKGTGYFGKMTAAMSHELKNCLAIMNENNGLIQDFTALALQGRPLDPERLTQVSERISRQIVRADDLLKQMNRFAHSVDRPEQQVDLNDAAALAASIGARLAANRQVEIRIEATDTPVSLTLSYFSLLNLIWQTMEAMMAGMAAETVLSVSVAKKENAVTMGFEASSPFTESPEPALKAADVFHLCSDAGAHIEVLPDKGLITLTFGK